MPGHSHHYVCVCVCERGINLRYSSDASVTVTMMTYRTFLSSGSDLKVFDGELLDVEDRLLSLLLPVRVLLF